VLMAWWPAGDAPGVSPAGRTHHEFKSSHCGNAVIVVRLN